MYKMNHIFLLIPGLFFKCQFIRNDQVIVPYRSFIELGRLSPILNTFETGFATYMSQYWEKLWREAVSGNEINGIRYGMARRWWGSVSNVLLPKDVIELTTK